MRTIIHTAATTHYTGTGSTGIKQEQRFVHKEQLQHRHVQLLTIEETYLPFYQHYITFMYITITKTCKIL
jgi:hypothetical protein